MGRRNFLVEGVSATGKTSVCEELQRRGHHGIHGDRELAYQDRAATFFCGGSRNFPAFLHLFDAVFVLTIDRRTLDRRLDQRPRGEWGSQEPERAHVQRLHRSGQDTPEGIAIDATAPLARVVDQILDLAARHGSPSP